MEMYTMGLEIPEGIVRVHCMCCLWQNLMVIAVRYLVAMEDRQASKLTQDEAKPFYGRGVGITC